LDHFDAGVLMHMSYGDSDWLFELNGLSIFQEILEHLVAFGAPIAVFYY